MSFDGERQHSLSKCENSQIDWQSFVAQVVKRSAAIGALYSKVKVELNRNVHDGFEKDREHV